MNCPECGHHIVEHGLDACYGLLDNGEVCTCTKNAVDVGKHFSDQLSAWKAEAMAARKVIDSAEWDDAAYVAYLAAKVKD